MAHRITSPEGNELAYEVHGQGPPLALVHGITENHHSFDPLIGPLAEHHRVIAVDLRGHGESDTASSYDLASMTGDLRHVLEHEGASDAVLLGHSLGGTVVTAYASSFPTHAVINVDQPLALGAFQAGLKQLEPMLRGNNDAFQQAISMVFDSMAGALPDAERSRIEAIRRAQQPVVLGVWAALLDESPESLEALVRHTFGHVKVPYLSLHGLDPGPGYADWLTELIPSAKCEVWADLGHYPHLVEPDRFLNRVREFLAGVAPA